MPIPTSKGVIIDGDLRDTQPDVGADELRTAIFADGFESSDTSAWTTTVP